MMALTNGTRSSSWVVAYFIGDVPKDQHTYGNSDNLVGIQNAFANRAAEQCGNCSNNADLIHKGFIHLNRYLVAKIPKHPTFDPEQINPLKYRRKVVASWYYF